MEKMRKNALVESVLKTKYFLRSGTDKRLTETNSDWR